ncbi:MAG: glycosyltransferase, partial [Anaerolineae bacterium]|nr:glycosyltransferase [Anaerolineae bacterium]
GHSHAPDLEMLKPVFVRLNRQYGQQIAFHFWGCQPPSDMQHWVNVKWHGYGHTNYREFAAWIADFHIDIGIAPLRDCLFNRCKSGLKYLEYSILGVPGVYSTPGPYTHLVQPGETGLLAQNIMEWDSALRQLIDNETMRKRIGYSAQQSVMDNHLLSDHSAQWESAYAKAKTIPTPDPMKQAPLSAVRYFAGRYEVKASELEQYTMKMTGDIERIRGNYQRRIADLEFQLDQRDRTIKTITQSPGWRFLAVAGRVRKWFVPSHSIREKVLYSAMAFSSNAFGTVGRWLRLYPHKITEKLISDEAAYRIVDLSTIQSPGLTIINIKNSRLNSDDRGAGIDSVLSWVEEQTYHDCDVIEWNMHSSSVVNATLVEKFENVVEFQDVCRLIRSPYLIFVTPSLFGQNETYLEVNMIALMSEHLAFTVNLLAVSDEEFKKVSQGYLPHNSSYPFDMMFVHKDSINADFKLILDNWQPARILGKILHHTTRHQLLPETVAYTQPVPVGLYISGQYYVRDPQRHQAQILHSVDSAFPESSLTSDLPTVFVVMPYIAVGGAENVALDLMRVLHKDVRFVVISVDPHDHALGTKADEFRQITPYVYTVPDFLHAELRDSFWHYLISRFNPAVFYVANGSENIYSDLMTLKQHYPDLRFANQVYDHRYGWIERYDQSLIEILDTNIGCNAKIREAFIARGVPASRAYHIDNGIDCSIFNPDLYPDKRREYLKAVFGLPQDTKVVTFMARLHPQKRPMDFLEVARRFRDDHTISFLIVGDGPLAAQLDLEIMRIGLQNVVRQPFSVGCDTLAISDVFVLPSEYEGMPLTILESLALGKPVVVTNVGNNRDVLNKTHGGVLIEQMGDINALRSGVLAMLESPPDPEKLRNAVIQNYSVERMARQYYIALLGE